MVARPAARMMPWNEATSPSRPTPSSRVYIAESRLTTWASASGSGASLGSVEPGA